MIHRLNVLLPGCFIQLVRPWTFRLYHENYNRKFLNSLKSYYQHNMTWSGTIDYHLFERYDNITLPANVVLQVTKYHLLSSFEEFSSIYFKIEKKYAHAMRDIEGKFWVRLVDANGLVYREGRAKSWA